jgi:hypothetical protein
MDPPEGVSATVGEGVSVDVAVEAGMVLPAEGIVGSDAGDEV